MLVINNVHDCSPWGLKLGQPLGQPLGCAMQLILTENSKVCENGYYTLELSLISLVFLAHNMRGSLMWFTYTIFYAVLCSEKAR